MKSSTVFNSSSFFILFFMFSIFVLWSTLLFPHRVVAASSLNYEGKALLSVLEKFSFDPYSIKLDWNLSSSNISPCDWVGIGCNTENTHVVSLNLSQSLIPGQLGPQIGQLSYLKSVDLSGNNLNGSIPTELWNCSLLQHLDLSSNNFIGELPDEAIRNLHQMNFLSISGNQISGGIPTELWNWFNLQNLDLSSNNFTGELPEALGNLQQLRFFSISENRLSGRIPEALGNLQQLRFFSISGNRLSGRIPESLFQLSSLEYVALFGNNLTGSIPLNIGNATNIKGLHLYNNSLHGNIPTSIANCTKLEVFDLRDNGLSGEIPLGLWRIPTLVEIHVGSNNLSGKLPLEMTELRQLKKIYLYGNQFSGFVPEDLGINTSLEYVDFGNNIFSGNIPPNLCFGKKLTYMRFDLNQFHGNIPSSYTRNCDSLRQLSLRGNKLTGSLPHFGQINNPSDPEITRKPPGLAGHRNFFVQGIQVLDFSKNNIQGRIPLSICSLIFLEDLNLSENQMNGTLPHCLGDLNQLLIVKLRSNNFSGTIPLNFTSYSLYTLDLNGNRLEGKIPRSLGVNSPYLRFLDLGNNQFNDTFSSFLETLSSSIEILVLRSNKLYGPLTRLALKNLQVLDISNNQFTGDLPLEFISGLDAMKHIDPDIAGKKRSYLEEIYTIVIHKGIETRLNSTFINTFRAIDMSNNGFQGVIPESIGELMWLKMFNLSNNNFNGRIPLSLGNLTQLESLDLSKNKLLGEIPWQLTKLNFLAALNLSSNNLKGRVPNGGQFQTFTNASFDGNTGLCGNPLSRRCEDDTVKERRRDPTEEKISYKNSNSWNFGWEPVVIGYGCGVLIGLVLQYFIFTKAFLYRWFG